MAAAGDRCDIGNARRYLNLFRNIDNWWLHFLIKFGLFYGRYATWRTKNGVLLETPMPMLHSFKEIFMEECYTHAIPIQNGRGMTIVDIGANIGTFVAFAAMRFPGSNIYAYEPVPANFRQLRRNADLNRSCRITCHQKAVSGKKGEITLGIETPGFSTNASAVARSGENISSIKVECVGIKDIFEENSLSVCDFLKIDCEGTEYEALLSCPPEYLAKIRCMAIETHSGTKPWHNTSMLRNHLEKQGFITNETPKASAMLYAWRKSL